MRKIEVMVRLDEVMKRLVLDDAVALNSSQSRVIESIVRAHYAARDKKGKKK